MKIVRFRDGTYGVRKGIFSHLFLGKDGEWWCVESNIRQFCRFKSIEEVRAAMPDHGKPVTEATA